MGWACCWELGTSARYKLSRYKRSRYKREHSSISYHLCACIALVNCMLQIFSLFSVHTCTKIRSPPAEARNYSLFDTQICENCSQRTTAFLLCSDLCLELFCHLCA